MELKETSDVRGYFAITLTLIIPAAEVRSASDDNHTLGTSTIFLSIIVFYRWICQCTSANFQKDIIILIIPNETLILDEREDVFLSKETDEVEKNIDKW